MYCVVLCLFIASLSAHANFCFDSAFANRTDLSSCVIKGKQNLGCDVSGLNAEYLYVRMSCDGLKEYDLPVGKSTHGTEHGLEDTIKVLDSNASVICTIEEKDEISVLCPGDVMNYSYIVCNINPAPGKNLPKFTQDRICHSSADSNALGLGLFIAIIFAFIF